MQSGQALPRSGHSRTSSHSDVSVHFSSWAAKRDRGRASVWVNKSCKLNGCNHIWIDAPMLIDNWPKLQRRINCSCLCYRRVTPILCQFDNFVRNLNDTRAQVSAVPTCLKLNTKKKQKVKMKSLCNPNSRLAWCSCSCSSIYYVIDEQQQQTVPDIWNRLKVSEWVCSVLLWVSMRLAVEWTDWWTCRHMLRKLTTALKTIVSSCSWLQLELCWWLRFHCCCCCCWLCSSCCWCFLVSIRPQSQQREQHGIEQLCFAVSWPQKQ